VVGDVRNEHTSGAMRDHPFRSRFETHRLRCYPAAPEHGHLPVPYGHPITEVGTVNVSDPYGGRIPNMDRCSMCTGKPGGNLNGAADHRCRDRAH
jgi:hypothetical protein